MNDFIFKEVEEILTEKFSKKITVQNSGSLGGGCINNASKIETNVGIFFLKWNGNCPTDIFLREEESLKELKKASDGQLIVPEVIASREVNETPGFLLQEYLKPRYSQGGDDERLGRGLASIHKYSADQFGFYNNNYCGSTLQNNKWEENWTVFFRDKRIGFLLNLIQSERPLPNSEMKTYEKLLRRIPDFIPPESTPVIIHGDLWLGNYMITENGPALIDPASYYADREMEFAIMTMFGGFSQRFYDAYNSVLPLPKDWRDRNQLYQLYHVLNHYYLFGGGYQSQAYRLARYFAG